jgi:hypothetical protein
MNAQFRLASGCDPMPHSCVVVGASVPWGDPGRTGLRVRSRLFEMLVNRAFFGPVAQKGVQLSGLPPHCLEIHGGLSQEPILVDDVCDSDKPWIELWISRHS